MGMNELKDHKTLLFSVHFSSSSFRLLSLAWETEDV